MDLEKELKKWREKRAQQPGAAPARPGAPVAATPDRRTVRVNGQEIVVVKKGKKSAS